MSEVTGVSRIEDIVEEAKKAQIWLYVEEGALRYKAKKGALTPDLKAALTQHKTEIIQYLQQHAPQYDWQRVAGHYRFKASASYAQKRLWFIDQLENGSPQYNMAWQIPLHAELHIDAFKQALQTILDRHAVLRTCFTEEDGEVYQEIREWVEFPFQQTDLRKLSEEERQLQVDRLVEADKNTVFDLRHDVLIRAHLLRLADLQYLLLFNVHHIASDGWSTSLLQKEFITLYEAYVQGRENPLPPLPIQYVDYAEWQRRWLQGEVLEKQLTYWKRQLADLPPIHRLPLDKNRPAQQHFAGRSYRQLIDMPLLLRLETLCREQEVTLFMLLQTAFSILLGRYSNETDVVMGTPIAGRTHADLDALIGFFVNTLVLRTDLEGNPSFIELLQKNKQTILDAYTYEHLPFEMLVDELKPERSLSYNPVVQVMFVLQNSASGEQPAVQEADLLPLDEDGPSTRGIQVKFDLTLGVAQSGAGLALEWAYNESLFMPETIQRLAQYFLNLLHNIATDAAQPIQTMNLLDAPEKQRLLVLGKHQPLCAGEQTIVSLFEEQMALTPDKIALIQGTQQLSYRELHIKSNQLAHFLIEQGIQTDSLVAICMHRSIEMIIGILGILKAGGAYVPVDPTYPAERIKHMLQDSGAHILITQSVWVQNLLLDKLGCKLLEIDKHDAELACQSQNSPSISINSDQLCYVIYTSGSTGQPNGVMVEHDSVARLVINADYVPLSQESRILQLSSVSFDAATFEIWGALLNGGTLVLYTDTAIDIVDLNCALEDYQINTLWLTAGLFEQWSESVPHLSRLKWLLAGGDVLNWQAVRRVHEMLPELTVINGYGPTENTTFSSCYKIPRNFSGERSLPIGGPINGCSLYVLDRNQALAPFGGVGELYVGGRGLARGYLNHPQLSQDRFISSPFNEGERLYKTGDLVRWNIDGELEFIGRVDNQIKIRGYRVELGEIEHQLLRYPKIKEVVVLAHLDKERDKRLVAYIVPTAMLADEQLDILKQTAAQHLPDYMRPSVFIILESLPLTANGKVDRKALPLPTETDFLQRHYVAPQDETEKLLCDIWQSLLQRERIGIHDNFFEAGGHSLLATRLVSRIRQVMKMEISLRNLFEAPTIAELADKLRNSNQQALLPELKPVTIQERNIPLSYAQQRLWFIDQLEGESAQYNIPLQLPLLGALDLSSLKAAWATLLQRHHILRTCYRDIDGEAFQIVIHDYALPFEEQDLSQLSEYARQDHIKRITAQDALKSFDLSQALPIRIQLLKLSEEHHLLLFNMHHIASDGWSMGILRQELEQLYAAYAQGQDNPLAPLRIQYADYAHWQRHWLQGARLSGELNYWRQQLQGIPPVHSLPLDKPRPAQQRFMGKSYQQTLNAELLSALESLCRKEQVTLFMLLQTAFSVVLSRYSHADDIVMGTPIAGRTHADLEPLIGFFVNTLVLRSDLSGNPSFMELLRKNKHTILDAYTHQHLPFEMLVDELKPERSLSYAPVFQIMFSLQTLEQDSQPRHAETATQSDQAIQVKFDLSLGMTVSKTSFSIGWAYNSDLFTASSIHGLSESYETLLHSIASDATQPIQCLQLLSDAQRQDLLALGGHDVIYKCSDTTIVSLFEQRAAEYPDKTAVIYRDDSLSYRELNTRANQLAHYLIEHSIKQDHLVALCMERSLDMIVGVLAILKAGGAYVPIDPTYPRNRIEYMLEDTGARIVLSQTTQSSLPLDTQQCLLLDTAAQQAELKRYPTHNPGIAVQTHQLCYVIYTSGSTGRPNGVMVEHDSVMRLAMECDYAPLNTDTVMLQTCSISFDVATFEFWGSLLNGGTLVLYPDTLIDITRLNHTLSHYGINTLWLTAGLFEQWSQQLPAVCDDLKWVLAGGDIISPQAVQRVYQTLPTVTLINGYGPTENTTFSTCHVISRGSHPNQSIPIGTAIPGSSVCVLDTHRNLTPRGGIGELYTGGRGVARGYLNRPELTAQRFIDDPYLKAQRLYKTGDLVRWNSNGQLEFIGRLDNQVKIRGYRIELGEVEHQLQQHPQIKEAVVLARSDDDQDKRLVAYLVAADPAHTTASREAVQEDLRQSLPGYMIPSIWVWLTRLPLTANGKIDRKRLPAPRADDLQKNRYVAPRTPTEAALCEIWQTLLNVEQVGIHDNFFALGGHSLLSIKMISMLNQRFNTQLAIREVFEHPTLQHLAKRVTDYASEEDIAWQPILSLTQFNDLPAAYIVPGVGMLSVSFQPLAQAMTPHWALKSLEARGMDPRMPPQKTLAEIADSYCEAMMQDQANGPYRLLGYSSGGAVAFEIARRLEVKGHVVELILLDCYLNFRDRTLLQALSSREALLYMLENIFKISKSALQQMNDTESVVDFLLSSEQIKNALVNSRLFPEEGYQNILRGLVQVYLTHYPVLMNYAPECKLKSNITMFFAEENSIGKLDLPRVERHYRNAMSGGRLRLISVKGNHYTMLNQENSIVLGAEVCKILQEGEHV